MNPNVLAAMDEFCEGFCKYKEMLKQVEETQAANMIKRIACDRCPLDVMLKSNE